MVNELKPGEVLEGRIAEVRNFGAFVWLEGGKKGLVHISEISDQYIRDIHNHFRPNDKVKTKIVSIKEDGKIELSIKQAEGLEYTRPPVEVEPIQRIDPGEYLKEPPEITFRHDRSGNGEPSFDDQLKRFKRQSDENLIDLKRNTENKRGGFKKRR